MITSFKGLYGNKETKEVGLEYERGYEKDKFNRLNAYVFVGEENINISIVRQGLAKVVIYKKRRKLMHQDQLLEAQEYAKTNKFNIWK